MNSITLRLFTPFVLTLLLATAVGWWVGTGILSRSLETRLAEQLEHSIEVLSERNFPLTQDVIQRAAQLVRANIIIFGNDLQPALSTLSTNNASLLKSVSKQYEQWLSDSKDNRWQKFTLDKIPYMLVFRKISPDRNSRYAAVASLANLSDVQQASRRAAWWLAGAALIGIPILAWLGHRIAHTITDPIRELATMATEIAKGERSIRARIHHQDEIGELTNALNGMAIKLTEYEEKIAENSRLAAAEQMAARVAHEIRNPLTAIKMQIQLLGEVVDTDHRATTNAILDEIRRLELIINNTLQSNQPQKLVTHKLDLNKLVNEVVHLQQAHFGHRGIQIKTRLDDALPEITLDADKIKQVLLNLLVNAGDELPDGGQVLIRTLRENDSGKISLIVEDSGPGIPDDLHETLFETSDSNKPGGLGLGLRITREIVEQHNGSLSLQTSHLGGAMFTIQLPMET